MKQTIRIILVLALSAFLPACANSGSSGSPRITAAQTEHKKPEFDRTTPPKLGMSREQVHSLYGEPKFRSASPRGEVWNYSFEGWKFMVPYYNMAAKIKTGTVTFNASGRVVDYQWGQSRSAFMMGM